MTPSNLRERVAKAMVAKDSGPEGSLLFKLHWQEFSEGYLTSADAAIAIALEEAAKAGDELGCECEGCGHLCGDPMIDMEIIRKAGGVSCCPERKMRPIGSAIRALKDT